MGTVSGGSDGGTTRRRFVRVAGECLAALSLVSGSGRAQSSSGGEGGELRWRFDVGKTVDSSPTAVDGTVYVGSNHGDVFAVDAETGEEHWRFETPGTANTSPTVVDGVVYVATDRSDLVSSGSEGYVYALDAANGTEHWRFRTEGSISSSPTAVDGTVYVGSNRDIGEGVVYAIDAADGTETWRVETETGMSSSPTAVDGTVYIGAEDMLALDAADGSEEWRFETKNHVESSPTVAGDTVYVGADGAVLALDVASGTEAWRFETDGDVKSSPTVADGTVYVGSHDSNVYALNGSDGTERWRFETKGEVNSSPTIAGGVVYVGSGTQWFGAGPEDTDTRLYAINAADGTERWRFETDGSVHPSPTAVDGTVYVGSFDGDLYALTAGVEGSSTDSRVDFGTLGHHGEWRYADATVDIPDISTRGWRLHFLLGAGAAGLLGIASAAAPGVDTDGSILQWDRTPFVGMFVIVISAACSTAAAVLLAPLGEYPLWRFWQLSATRLVHHAFAREPVYALLGYLLLGGVFLFAIGFGADYTILRGAKFERRRTSHAPPAAEVPSGKYGTIAGGLAVLLVLDLLLRIGIGTELGVPWLFVALLPTILTAGYAVHRYRCLEGSASADSGTTRGGRRSGQPSKSKTGGGSRSGSTDQSISNRIGSSDTRRSGGGTATTGSAASNRTAEPTDVSTKDEPIDKSPDSPTDEGPSPADVVDDRLNELDEALETAEEASATAKYGRALDACRTAVSAGKDALEAARGGATDRVEEARSRLEDARRRREAVEAERDARADAVDSLEEIESELDRIAEGLEAGDVGSAADDLEALPAAFDAVAETIEEHDISELEPRAERLRKRCDTLRDRAESSLETTESVPETIPTTPGRSLPHEEFQKKELIGSGGNANVYRAAVETDEGDLTLAVKEPQLSGTLHASDAERILGEAETWQELDDHDHIVSVVDYGEDPLPWIAMEYMDAGHLGDRAGDLPIQQALWIALSVTQGVRHAHQRGVIHLDLKPENILFRSVEDAWDVPKVADWGLSKRLLEHSNSVEGLTVQYAAPEQFDPEKYGPPDNKTDVYQLGAVFYELFTGRPPFEGSDFEVIERIRRGNPQPASDIADVPAEVDAILETAMSRDKSDRYEDVLYLRDALRELLAVDAR